MSSRKRMSGYLIKRTKIFHWMNRNYSFFNIHWKTAVLQEKKLKIWLVQKQQRLSGCLRNFAKLANLSKKEAAGWAPTFPNKIIVQRNISAMKSTLWATGIISYAIFLCNILNIFFKVFCALRVFYTSKSPTFLENPRTFRHKKTPENQKFPRFW